MRFLKPVSIFYFCNIISRNVWYTVMLSSIKIVLHFNQGRFFALYMFIYELHIIYLYSHKITDCPLYGPPLKRASWAKAGSMRPIPRVFVFRIRKLIRAISLCLYSPCNPASSSLAFSSLPLFILAKMQVVQFESCLFEIQVSFPLKKKSMNE